MCARLALLAALAALAASVALAFPARPSSNVLHPRHIHRIFLRLKARRARAATARFAAAHLSAHARLHVVHRVGLAFEPCASSADCQGDRSCSQLAGSASGSVDLVDCGAGMCFCTSADGCAATDDCLDGETCASSTCLSNSFVPGAAVLDDADPALGLNLDPCQTISDCQNPRNCVQYVDGVFGQCSGPNCFCIKLDPSCTSASQCSQGESCTKRESANNAICISETAVIADSMDEQIDDIPDSGPALPPMVNVPAMQPPAAQPSASQPPSTQPPAMQPAATQPPATQPPASQPPATQPPATSTAAVDVSEQPQEAETTETAEVVETPDSEQQTQPLLPPAVSTPGGDETLETMAPEAEAPTDTTDDDGGEPATTDEAEQEASEAAQASEAEQADREPAVVVPGGDGAAVSPDSEQGAQVLPTDDAAAVDDEEDGAIGASPVDDLLDVESSAAPEADGEDGGAPDSVEDEICIGEHHLVQLAREELLYASNRYARVLCDERNSCATPGHIVTVHGRAMMMATYCGGTACVQRVMKVNSPRYRRAARVRSHTSGLSFTAFAARYATAAEERVLRTFVHMGL